MRLRPVDLVVTALTIAGGFGMLVPFLWMVSASLRPIGEAYQLPPSLIPDVWDIRNYIEVLTSRVPFPLMFWNSFLVATLVTAGVLATSSLAAFAFARLRFPGRSVLFFGMLIGLMVPPALVLIPIYLGYAATGLLDTRIGLALPSVASSFGVYMMRQFMLRQPRELEEAALVDGAGYWTIFRRV
ncbi:MAG TPA: carbohydrate ABC transporter permease, partial [Acetobacteraceae bacterium]|nr:carbohydrate ABC transporter permease [Acetobacteraceae bacterium]